MGAMGTYRSVFRPDLLRGQVVWITGGGTGIGRCIAHEVAALGAVAVVSGRREESLRGTVAEIEDAGGRAGWLPLDIRDADAVDATAAAVVERFGRIDGLVNNAGGQFPSPAEAISPNGWRTVVDLNLNGTFLVTRAAFHAWMGGHGGAVVSIVADMWNGFPFMSHTGAARAAVVNLTKSLAVEWAARGLRVNAVAPGLVFSSGMSTYDPAVQRAAAATARKIPAGRIGTESETSAAVVFLLSEAAAFVTGETIRVDGGASLLKEPMLPLGEGDALPAYDGFHLAREVPGFWAGEED
jgi:citronellol/citronellal dehydrogenase